MDAIKDIIPNVLGPLSQGQQGPSGLLDIWRRSFSDAAKTKIISHKDGVLIVHVDHAARLVRLNQQKDDILKKLQQQRSDIKEIRFRVGKIGD